MPALLLLFALACTREGSPDAIPEPTPDAPSEAIGDGVADPVAADETEPVLGDPVAGKTPADLYAECEARVEGQQQAGECTTDADCSRAGCSQEVCVTSAAAADVMTTCEIKPCFQVLDSCGCHDGVCSWTLKTEVPRGPKIPDPADVPQ